MSLLKSRFCRPAPSGCARRPSRVISHRSADVTEGSLQDVPVPNTTPGFTLCLQNGPALPGSDEGILEQEASALGSRLLFRDHSAGGSSGSKEGTSEPGQGGGSASSLRAAPCSWASSEKRAADRGPPAGAEVLLCGGATSSVLSRTRRSPGGDGLLIHPFILFILWDSCFHIVLLPVLGSGRRSVGRIHSIISDFIGLDSPGKKKSLNSTADLCVSIEYNQRYRDTGSNKAR